MQSNDSAIEVPSSLVLGEETTTASSAASAISVATDRKSERDLTDDIPMTFPQRLMEILSNATHADIITWLPHGRAFIIYKKKKFAAEVLPRYFKQSKFTSFTRKLNRWGFTRITRGPETGAYFHKFFQRDDPRLCMQMSCQNVRLQNELEHQMHAHQHFQQQHHMPQINMLNLMQMQQMQLEQLQQQQQLQAAELVRRAMVPPSAASFMDAQQPTPPQQAIVSPGMGVSMDSALPKPDDSLYLQMLAQSKASTQPLMMAIQNSLRSSGSPMPQPPVSQDQTEQVRRASAA